MSTTRRKSRFRCFAALVLAVGLVAAACSSDDSDDSSTPATEGSSGDLAQNVAVDESGVTDTAINFAVLGTETGNPFGTCLLQCYTDGIEAYFEYRNTESDGIYGRQLEVTDVVDDEFGKNQEKALQIIAADDTFATFSQANIATGWADLAAEGIPLYVWNIEPSYVVDQEGIFGNSPVFCQTCTSRPQAYAMEQVDITKLSSVGYGVSDSSKNCAKASRDTADTYGPEIGGAENVYFNDALAFGFPNGIAPEVTAMKDAGANGLVACIENTGYNTILEEAKKQGLSMNSLLPNAYNAEYISQQGGLFDGSIVQVSFRPLEATRIPIQDKYLEYMEKLNKESSELAIIGWINASLAYEGLVAAGPEFSREKVIDATNQFTDFTADGWIAPVDWTKGHTALTPSNISTDGQQYQCGSYVKIVDNAFEIVGDADKPFSCWPGDTLDWSEPEAMS
ncbi:MAG TPA: hypothetical protein VIY72_06365, partial [Acidimicrobiales bacterium]